ncbi:MAG: 3'(2'),5'-bisphosphate nucleotidase CysQ [Hyphomicrobiales bacterium]|nr:3'(2'),5'-bisphosphate nucleotidase CysQ [Hyphomicrobiales bacterium]
MTAIESPSPRTTDALFQGICEVAREAGRKALAWFEPGASTRAEVTLKGGYSPVSAADLEVDRYLRMALRELVPQAGWLSEETPDDGSRRSSPEAFIIDPIDGTGGFIRGEREWCVSIALVRDGVPVMAVVEAPALGETFTAQAGAGAWLNKARICVAQETAGAPLRLCGPARIASLSGLPPLQLRPRLPSLAYRLMLVADGRLDATVASPNAHDWDIAAADLILREAGGVLIDHNGEALRYDRAELRHKELFAGRPSLAEMLRRASR